MALTLTIENETSLPDGGPLSVKPFDAQGAFEPRVSALSAAVASQAESRPRTWLASEGVTPESITSPRATSRSSAATSIRLVRAAASGIGVVMRARTAASRVVSPPD